MKLVIYLMLHLYPRIHPFGIRRRLLVTLNLKVNYTKIIKKTEQDNYFTKFKQVRTHIKYKIKVAFDQYLLRTEVSTKHKCRNFWSFIN